MVKNFMKIFIFGVILFVGVLYIADYQTKFINNRIEFVDNNKIQFFIKLLIAMSGSLIIVGYVFYDMNKAHSEKKVKPLYSDDMRFLVSVNVETIAKKFKDFSYEYRAVSNSKDGKLVFIRSAEHMRKDKFIETRIFTTRVELKKISDEVTEVYLKFTNGLHIMDYNASLYALKEEIIGMVS